MAHVDKGTPYYSEQSNRHGKPVYYYRRPGFPRIRLNEKPGTPAMDRAFYRAAEKTDQRAAAKAAGEVADIDRPMTVCRPTTNPDYARRFGDTAEPGAIGTLRHMCDAYMAGDDFINLDRATASKYRCNLMRACALRTKDGENTFGEWLVSAMKPKHVETISTRLKDLPTVADNTCKQLRGAFNWAIRHEVHTGINPAVGFILLRNYDNEEDPEADGHFTWEDWHLERYMARHPIGSPARMAFALMYYGGVRKSDAQRLGRGHLAVNDSELHWTEWKGSRSQVKGKHRPKPKPRKMGIHPELARTIAGTRQAEQQRAAARGVDIPHSRFVLTQDGRPYTDGGFDWVLPVWIEEAGLPTECTPHGIRKASAALMFENGATESELCSIFGWKVGSRMAAYYARKFNQRRAQERAFTKLPQLGGEATGAAA